MTFLPVVERELRVAARRRHTYWTRFIAALSTVVLAAWIWDGLDHQPAHERGQFLFRVIAGLAFCYSLLAGIGITADCLSEEKREGTLGLLFLTDLKGYDVVLGKLAATSLNAAYRLIAVFPILAIPLLLGALTLGEFWRMLLVLTNTLFFSLAAGIFVSSISRQERRAMCGTIFLLVSLTVLPPLIGYLLTLPQRIVPYNTTWLLSSGAYPAILADDVLYMTKPQEFWYGVGTTHLLGWIFLILASALVRRAWQDRPRVGKTASWWDSWQAWKFAHGPTRRAFRERLLNINPVLWLAGRNRFRPIYTLAAIVGFLVFWLGLYLKFHNILLDPFYFVLVAYAGHTLIKLWVASDACRTLTDDRKSGALELLLSTPCSVDEILTGQILALKRQFVWPVWLLLLSDLAMMSLGAQGPVLDASNSWLIFWLGLILMFIVDLYTLAWVGFWLSLNAKKTNRATAGAIGRVLILPWALFTFGLIWMASIPSSAPQPTEITLMAGGFTMALVIDAILYIWASRNLQHRFRLLATQRFDAKGRLSAAPPAVGPFPAAVPPPLPKAQLPAT